MNARSTPADGAATVPAMGAAGTQHRYARIAHLIATDSCVLLDGATGTELIDVGGKRPESEEHLWGVTEIMDSPSEVEAVHRRYVHVGGDVVSTNTWGLPTALRDGGPKLWESFGRAARRFEEMGVGALAVNCVPPDHVTGMLSWLRDFTDLPLGVYPNLGYLSAAGWRHELSIDGPRYAELALGWREEGAQIIGGCCGVGPEHLAAARDALRDTKPGHRRPALPSAELQDSWPVNGRSLPRWSDARGRPMFPLEFPEIGCEPGVFEPTQGSFLLWKYLYREGIGAHQRCLDIGCGTGLLTVQLARNGAAHVHAIDIDETACKNTLTNAFRNGVADRVSAAPEDLYPWVPEERYDLIVASLYQMPVDPFEQVTTHRPLDYWGRNLLDHLIRLLPDALADDGTAYIMQLSIIGERRTAALLDGLGLQSRVVDFGFFEFHDLFKDKREQIARVEEHSDAYHLTFANTNVMVAYLIEVTRERAESTEP